MSIRKTKTNILTCQICKEKFQHTISIYNHIKGAHHLRSKQYYDKFFKTQKEGVCYLCGKQTNYFGLTDGYAKFCSTKCMANSKLTKEKRRKTSLKKYGCTSPNQSSIVKQNKEKSCMKKYGKKYYVQTEEFKRNFTKIMLKKYGTKHALQNKELLEKSKQTCQKHFGVDFSFQSKIVRKKGTETKIKKYNNPNYDNPDKKRLTCLKRYGVSNPSQYLPFIEKIKNNNYKRSKKYKLPSGKIISLHGYEPQFLNYIFNNKIFKEKEIIYYPGGIKYRDVLGKTHYYFPDFKIPGLNVIIEIKSWWTLKQDKNYKRKRNACIKQGYKHILILDNNFNKFNKFLKSILV